MSALTIVHGRFFCQRNARVTLRVMPAALHV
jgi:hypothetical protein